MKPIFYSIFRNAIIILNVLVISFFFCAESWAKSTDSQDYTSEITPPALLTPIVPQYPVSLTLGPKAVTGIVEILLTLNENGRPVEVLPVTWTTLAFVDPATVAVSAARFSPAMFPDGTSVAVQIALEVFFAPPIIIPPARSTLRGIIIQRGSKIPLAGAVVAAVGTTLETVSDSKGLFELSALSATSYTFKVLAPDHEVFLVQEEFGENEIVEVAYYLEPTYYSGLRIRVQGTKVRKEVSRQSVQMAEIVAIPGVGQDPVRVVQVLAGVATPNDLSGNLLIRGSDDRDNFFEIDGLQVPYIYHVGGLSSVFSGFLVDTTDFFPSNFGAKYSDAVGGAIVVRSREPDDKIWRGSVSVGTLWSEAFVEGPVTDSVSVYGAYRRSYFDLILKAALPDTTGVSFTTAPSFEDYQGKVSWRINPKNTLTLLGFGARDKLELLVDKEQLVDPETYREFGFTNSFHAIRGSWRYRRGTLFENQFMIGFVANPFEVRIGQDDFLGWNFNTTTIRDDASFKIPGNGRIHFGAWANIQRGTLRARFPRAPRPGEYDYDFETAERVESEDPAEYELYTGYMELEQPVGPVSGTLGVNVIGHSELPYTMADPRFALRWDVQEGTMLKGGVGVYHQFPPYQYLFSGAGGNPENAPPGGERSWHYLVGVEQELPWQIKGILELYYKKMDRRLWQTDDPFDPVRFRNTGEGRAYGVEVSVKKPLTDRIFGWVSYSYSVSERKNPQDTEWKKTEFDQPHIVNAILSWQITKKWRVGGRWRYSTGNPKTSPEKAIFYADSQSYLPVFSEEPDHRLPAYQRLDLRVDYTWVFQRWTLSSFFELLNVYNYTNPLDEIYAFDYSKTSTVDSFPFLPYFGLRADF